MKISTVKKMLLTLGVAGLIGAAGNVQAAEIQGVAISGVSSQTYTYPSTATYSVTNLVTSTGLFGDDHCFLPGGAMWLSAAGANNTNFVTFNLGGVYTLNAIKVWNYNDSAHLTYGVASASISYSMDGVTFTTAIASQAFNEAPGNFTAFAQTIPLPSAVTAQYVRINVNTNWGGGTAGVGLAKVRFISNTNLPTVLSASENFGSNQVTVVFSESVNAATALNSANYSISGTGPAVTISSVTMGEYADRVILHTSLLTGNNYSVGVSGVYDEANTAAVASNSSVPVQSELYLWLRADQGVTTTPAFGGNMLTTWNDQSPYGHNAEPANFFGVLTNQPFLAPNVVNGQPAVEFFGTNVMEIPNDAANPINGDMTLFMVLSTPGSTANQDPISKTGGGSNTTTTNNLAAPFDFYFNSASKPLFYFGNNGVVGNNIGGGQAISGNTFYVVAVSVSATNLAQVIFDGSSPMSDLSLSPANKLSAYQLFGAAPGDAGNPIAIGARNSGPISSAQPFIGYLPEVMLIRGTITPGDFTSIEKYLAAKYAVAPPVITEQPANLTANAGSAATFWAGASGMQPFSYQWQSNGVAIAGATNMSYTTPYLTASANNASYTVTISNATGTTNSTAATLTVVTPTKPPTVSSAVKSAALNSVLVVFSEAIDPATGLNAANYSINGGASVTSAAAGSSANQVVLTTSQMSTNGLYSLAVKNVQDLNGNAMAGVTVPVMPASLTMWLKADSGVVTNATTGSTVDAWLDQTANGNNAQTYGVGPNYRPSLGTDPINGKPAVLFNGNNNFLVAASSPGLAMTGDMSIYAVVNISDYSNYRDIISKDDGSTTYANSYDLYANKSGGQLYWNRGDGTSYHTATLHSSAIPAQQPVVLGVIHQGTGAQPKVGGTGNVYMNGNNVTTTAFTTATFGDFGSSVYIGMRNSMDLNLNGNIAEVMVFSNAISGFDRTNIDNYLGVKYFAFTNTLPLTNETVDAGQMATFTAAASEGTAHLMYQWVENGTNIPGATGLSYTTPPMQASDNGDTFALDVVVPGTATNVIGPVTLTVVTVPPIVTYYGSAIWATTTNTILVNFQEPLNPAMATNAANYSLNNGAKVLSAIMWSPTQVLLTTTPLNNPPYTLTVQNLQAIYGGPIMAQTNCLNVSGSFYPPNLAVWLRADEGVSTNSDFTVNSWNDQSGNGNTFNSGGGTLDPTYVPNAVNGLPALWFNGTNESVMIANNSPSLSITGDMAIFAVMNFSTYGNVNGAASGGPGGGEIISKNCSTNYSVAGPYDYYIYYNAPYDPYFLRGPGGNFFAPGPNSPSTGVWHELSAVMRGNTITHRLDGHQNGAPLTFPNGSLVADEGDDVYIGVRHDENVRLTGYMAELIMVGSTLSTNDWTAIETYLGNKYGIISTPGMLGISTANKNAVVSWLAPQWSYVLQATPSLNPVSWANVTNTPTLINNTNVVSVPTTNQMFYRLESQSQ